MVILFVFMIFCSIYNLFALTVQRGWILTLAVSMVMIAPSHHLPIYFGTSHPQNAQGVQYYKKR